MRRSLPRPLRRLIRDTSGSVSIEMTFVVTLMCLVTGGAVELGWAYNQHSSAQTAARHGARLAATLDPVSPSLSNRSVALGAYNIDCQAGRGSCTGGSYNGAAMARIVFGPDSDGACGATDQPRRGMCDVYADLRPEQVSIRYTSTGLAGNNASGNPVPVIEVTIAERPLRTVLLGPLLPGKFARLPEVSAVLMGEDLDG